MKIRTDYESIGVAIKHEHNYNELVINHIKMKATDMWIYDWH